jgi:hypothetical protein
MLFGAAIMAAEQSLGGVAGAVCLPRGFVISRAALATGANRFASGF